MPKPRAEQIDAAMLDALEEALTPEVSRRVLEFAKRRAGMMRLWGCEVADDEARSLAQDALTDTLTGVAPWESGGVALGAHLRAVIRRRTAHRIAWAGTSPHRSVDVARLAEAAAAGPLARAILSAYVGGATTRGEVLAATGMSVAEFIDGRRRLDRMLAALPDDLNQPAAATMERTP